MIREYTHELNREVRSISGGYELEREEKFDMHGKEVLYVVGNAVVDSSCCGVGGAGTHWFQAMSGSSRLDRMNKICGSRK
jgi:hypothetical protein